MKATAVSATGLKSVTRGRKQTPFVQWRLAGNVNTVGSGTDDLATIEEGATMLGEGVDPVWDEPLPDISVPGDLLLRARASTGKAGQSTGEAALLLFVEIRNHTMRKDKLIGKAQVCAKSHNNH